MHKDIINFTVHSLTLERLLILLIVPFVFRCFIEQFLCFKVEILNAFKCFTIMLQCYFSSAIIWEQCKLGARRYKKIEGPKMLQLEEAYQRYLKDKIVSDDPVSPRVMIDEKTEVCF